MGILYCYTNLINNKKYIGQTINPKQRYSQHKSSAFNKNDKNYDTPFHRAIRKYGWENFDYKVLLETDDINILNKCEVFFIEDFKTQIPNGYNILEGGLNSCKHNSEEAKEKMRWSHATLTKEEVIALRLSYKNKESPKKIYEEQYKDRMTYQAFYNIWTGKRYWSVMPEVIETGRHTKLDWETVRKIRETYAKENISYRKLGPKFNVSASTIADIICYRTWKDDPLEKESVETILESKE